MKDGAKNKKYLMCFAVIWVMLMAAAVYFCTQKQGFHEDEFYTYYSTARTNGFYVGDGEWMERETYYKEFVVLPGEQFQYGLVKQVQSWDVHPPMYYWVFHTAASLVPGVFSKWIGLSVNLLFHGINLILLTYLAYLVNGKNAKAACLVTVFFGLGPAAMSGVVFIRMYEMLTAFVLLCAVLHVRAVQRLEDGSGWGERLPLIKFLLPMAVVTYVGFLTQYYYFIFLFYMAVAFCVYLLWRDRKLYNCLRYAVSQSAAFVLAYLTYPVCLGQMFRGQRGAQATENFFDLSNTFERFRFFFDLLDEYVFGNMLSVFLLLIVVMALAVYFRKRRGRKGIAADGRAVFWMLLFTAAGYFFTVAKTALLLGNTSNRYQLPIYGIVVLLVFWTISGLWRQIAGREGFQEEEKKDIRRWLVPFAVTAFCLAVDLSGLCADRVAFLYPQAKEETAQAKAHAVAGVPVVYVYKPGEEWCIWAVADVLMEYDRVYFVSDAGDKIYPAEEFITESTIAGADAVVAYFPVYDDAEDEEEQSMRIFASCGASKASRLYRHKYCDSWYYSSE